MAISFNDVVTGIHMPLEQWDPLHVTTHKVHAGTPRAKSRRVEFPAKRKEKKKIKNEVFGADIVTQSPFYFASLP